jgi:DNA-binding MarR family transcriptional regulator
MVEQDDALAAAVAVRRGVMSLGRRLKAERQPGGFTSLELSVLGYLYRHGPMTPGELADAERVQPQTLTRTLANLEQQGLLSRRDHPDDGRRVLLALTQGGQDALRSDMTQRDAWLAGAMADRLTRAESEVLRLAADLMEQLAQTAGR